MQSFSGYGMILGKSNRVARWTSLPHLRKRGGGADGYIPDFEPVVFRR